MVISVDEGHLVFAGNNITGNTVQEGYSDRALVRLELEKLPNTTANGQRMLVAGNRLANNSFPTGSTYHSVAMVITAPALESPSETPELQLPVVSRNIFDNPQAQEELFLDVLASHQGQATGLTADCAHNYWGAHSTPQVRRIHDALAEHPWPLPLAEIQPVLTSQPGACVVVDLRDPAALFLPGMPSAHALALPACVFSAPNASTEPAVVNGTRIGGLLRQNLTINAASGPLVLSGQLLVMPGATLTVEAGSNIQYELGAGITVRGRLQVLGTPASPVQLTAVRGNASAMIACITEPISSSLYDFESMSVARCQQHCRDAEAPFAALYPAYCVCLRDYRHAPSHPLNTCRAPCSAAFPNLCGNVTASRLAVYESGLALPLNALRLMNAREPSSISNLAIDAIGRYEMKEERKKGIASGNVKSFHFPK